MFLDDDIYEVSKYDTDAMAVALEDHSVSTLIPEHYPDNSVACHAHRLGGGVQTVFASASGMGVRCDRSDLGFFPDIYNEDWFFFSADAAAHRIARIGVSKQREYDPYENPNRAAQEEFGDLLAEGMYALLDIGEQIDDIDVDYWSKFMRNRDAFHDKVLDALPLVKVERQAEAIRAAECVRAAKSQLLGIDADLCGKFVKAWHEDLKTWRDYLATRVPVGSLSEALASLGVSSFTTTES